MKKICDFYVHRGYWISKEHGGWTMASAWDTRLEVFKTLTDAKNFIDKRHDGSNKAEPRIIKILTYEDILKGKEGTQNG